MDKIHRIQQKIGVMKKDTQGYNNYKYFDINQLLEKLTPLLHEEGLILTQPLTEINGKPAIRTIVTEKTTDYQGTLLDFTFPLPDLIKPQEMGSAITYYRRYSLQSLFALEAEDDDASSTNEKKVSKRENYNTKTKALKDNGGDPLQDDII